jgi:cytochrome c-type biogenesis protein CcmE
MLKNKSFVVAGVLIVVAVGYLIISSTSSTARYFLTLEEVQTLPAEQRTRDLTVSGAVIGESITYDPEAPRVTFTIVNIPGDLESVEAAGGLAAVLHAAVENPDAPRMQVVYDGVKPDLLQDEAQAIVRGRLQEDGTFYADELLLKCPSRYTEELPEQRED